ALENALIGATDEPTPAEASDSVVDGTTAVVPGGSSPLTAAALTLSFELGIPSVVLLSTATSNDLAESLRRIYTSTAFVSALEEDRKVPFDFQGLVTLLARTAAPSAAFDALPFAGWIANAVNIASPESGAAPVADVGTTVVTLAPSRGAGEYPVYAS